MAGPNDIVGDWNLTLTPDNFGEFSVAFTLSVATVDPKGGMTGQIKNGPALSNGKCVQGINTGGLLMSCALNLPGALIFLAGVVTGNKPNCKFDGHYLLISQNAGAMTAAGAAAGDPGETGTGGGQQST